MGGLLSRSVIRSFHESARLGGVLGIGYLRSWSVDGTDSITESGPAKRGPAPRAVVRTTHIAAHHRHVYTPGGPGTRAGRQGPAVLSETTWQTGFTPSLPAQRDCGYVGLPGLGRRVVH